MWLYYCLFRNCEISLWCTKRHGIKMTMTQSIRSLTNKEMMNVIFQQHEGTENNNYFLDSQRVSGIKMQTTQGNIFNIVLSKMKEKKKHCCSFRSSQNQLQPVAKTICDSRSARVRVCVCARVCKHLQRCAPSRDKSNNGLLSPFSSFLLLTFKCRADCKVYTCKQTRYDTVHKGYLYSPCLLSIQAHKLDDTHTNISG